MGIEELLDRQSGVVARLQLRAAGCDELDLARATADRGWRGVHPGVYVTGADPLTWLQRGWVALLLAWPAALCHRSALRVADGPGRRGGGDAVIHVAVDRDSAFVAPPGVRAHRLDGLGDRVRWDLSPPRVHVEEAVLEVAAEIAARRRWRRWRGWRGSGHRGRGARVAGRGGALPPDQPRAAARRPRPPRPPRGLARGPGPARAAGPAARGAVRPGDPDRDPGRRRAHRGLRTTIGLTSRAGPDRAGRPSADAQRRPGSAAAGAQRQAGASGSGAGTPTAGMPSETPDGRGPGLAGLPRVAGAGAPDREHRAVGDQVVRGGVGELDGDHVAGPDPGGVLACEKSAAKCTSRLSGARPESRWVSASLRPSPSATISSTVRPTSALFSSQAISLTSATSRS